MASPAPWAARASAPTRPTRLKPAFFAWQPDERPGDLDVHVPRETSRQLRVRECDLLREGNVQRAPRTIQIAAERSPPSARCKKRRQPGVTMCHRRRTPPTRTCRCTCTSRTASSSPPTTGTHTGDIIPLLRLRRLVLVPRAKLRGARAGSRRGRVHGAAAVPARRTYGAVRRAVRWRKAEGPFRLQETVAATP